MRASFQTIFACVTLGVSSCGGGGASDGSPRGEILVDVSLASVSANIAEPTALSWSSRQAESCELSGPGLQIISAETGLLSGEATVASNEAGTLTVDVTCRNADDIARESVNVNVLAPKLERVDIYLDGTLSQTFGPLDPITIEDPTIRVADTWIAIAASIANAGPSLACELNGTALDRESTAEYKWSMQAAYFRETFEFRCMTGAQPHIDISLELRAEDPELLAYVADFLSSELIEDEFDTPGDPYRNYRPQSYYTSIHKLIGLAGIYADANAYGINPESERITEIENYLVNVAESYFEPCPGYEFLTGPARQCRSEERIGPYYRWRSPNDSPGAERTAHAKVEWRAAAAIAQAIKPIILANAPADSEICPIADAPSAIRTSSLGCRALNVRRLLHDEFWIKWSDAAWVASLGQASERTIQGANISHYIGWLLLVEDLFDATADVTHNYGCLSCARAPQVESTIDNLIAHFKQDANGYISIVCRLPQNGVCNWNGYPLHAAGANDLSHLDTLIHLISMYRQKEICSASGATCYSIADIARTANEKIWMAMPPSDAAVEFPKFDPFMNGYCGDNINNIDSPLYEFCDIYWVQDAGPWKPHKKLMGWVNLGSYNRDLMIKLRVAADENQDGMLNADDIAIDTFAIPMLRTLAN